MEYILKGENGEYKIDAEKVSDLNLLNLNGDGYHLLKDSKSFAVSLIKLDKSNKTVEISINGKAYKFKIEDKLDQLIRTLGFDTKSDSGTKNIVAPMPGLILDVMIQEGEDIEEGTPLFILEAMKMENIIKASTTGRIKKILKTKGDKAEKNELIIELE